MQSRDYLERMIQSLADALARIAGFTAEGLWDEAERALDEQWRTAFGIKRGDVFLLDGATLRALLGGKASHAGALLAAEANLAEARGNMQRAESLREKARTLAGSAHERRSG